MQGKSILAWLACALALAAGASNAADTIKSKSVQFRKGESSATIKASLKGDEIIDYKLRAKSGQTMTVTLKASNASMYFNVLPPHSSGEAIFIGSTGGDSWTGTLPTDGEYAIRVYLMRNAARRNEASGYELTVGVSGAAVPAGQVQGKAAAGDAKVKGTPYNATGKVRCSAGSEPAGSKECEFGVIRGAGGSAQVDVTYPGGLKTVLRFAGGKVSADGAQSVKATKAGDTWSVEVNDYEHYQIPDAVVAGG